MVYARLEFSVQARWVSAFGFATLSKKLKQVAVGLGIAYVAALRAKVPVLLLDRSVLPHAV